MHSQGKSSEKQLDSLRHFQVSVTDVQSKSQVEKEHFIIIFLFLSNLWAPFSLKPGPSPTWVPDPAVNSGWTLGRLGKDLYISNMHKVGVKWIQRTPVNDPPNVSRCFSRRWPKCSLSHQRPPRLPEGLCSMHKTCFVALIEGCNLRPPLLEDKDCNNDPHEGGWCD